MPTNKLPVEKLKSGAPRRRGGRPAGSLNKRTILRKALQDGYPDGEEGFWRAVVELVKAGDTQAMTMIADRIMPKLKPQGEIVKLTVPDDATAADMARAVMQATAAGKLSTDAARELLAAIADMVKIVEATELEERIKRLEEAAATKEQQ
ncbi:hypothetical protein ACMSSJ_13815 [Kerstersia gyiorum]|uniref:hypothetical protein n=1 Tax=Kerstersia gyiorum TaxID=206506 RepID=UPI0039ECAC83